MKEAEKMKRPVNRNETEVLYFQQLAKEPRMLFVQKRIEVGPLNVTEGIAYACVRYRMPDDDMFGLDHDIPLSKQPVPHIGILTKIEVHVGIEKFTIVSADFCERLFFQEEIARNEAQMRAFFEHPDAGG